MPEQYILNPDRLKDAIFDNEKSIEQFLSSIFGYKEYNQCHKCTRMMPRAGVNTRTLVDEHLTKLCWKCKTAIHALYPNILKKVQVSHGNQNYEINRPRTLKRKYMERSSLKKYCNPSPEQIHEGARRATPIGDKCLKKSPQAGDYRGVCPGGTRGLSENQAMLKVQKISHASTNDTTSRLDTYMEKNNTEFGVTKNSLEKSETIKIPEIMVPSKENIQPDTAPRRVKSVRQISYAVNETKRIATEKQIDNQSIFISKEKTTKTRNETIQNIKRDKLVSTTGQNKKSCSVSKTNVCLAKKVSTTLPLKSLKIKQNRPIGWRRLLSEIKKNAMAEVRVASNPTNLKLEKEKESLKKEVPRHVVTDTSVASNPSSVMEKKSEKPNPIELSEYDTTITNLTSVEHSIIEASAKLYPLLFSEFNSTRRAQEKWTNISISLRNLSNLADTKLLDVNNNMIK